MNLTHCNKYSESLAYRSVSGKMPAYFLTGQRPLRYPDAVLDMGRVAASTIQQE
ncbi:MAG: hypothetical protein ACI9DH_000346 [Halioglobus sp.]|jgi:hypothetical protein